MADKVPVKATFDSAGDADGLSEFVSGDTIPITHGGTGLAAVGSAGQILRTNSSANAIEWGAAEVLNIDGMTDGTSVTLADTDKLAVSDGGTEKYINLSQVKTYVGPLSLIDEDDMATNSATRPPSQQSVKAYVDGNDLSLIDEDDMASNSATRPPSQQSVKAYADTKATTSNRLDEFANPTSAIDVNDQELQKAVLKDYAETDVAVTSGATLSIDLANGNTGAVTLAHNVTDIDFTNVPTNGTATFTLKATQDGTGSRTMAINAVTVNGGSHATAKTAGGSGLTLSTGANDVDLVTFLFFDAGTPLLNALLDFS